MNVGTILLLMIFSGSFCTQTGVTGIKKLLPVIEDRDGLTAGVGEMLNRIARKRFKTA